MIRRRLKEKIVIGFSMMAVAFMLATPFSMVIHASESSVVENVDIENDANSGIALYSDIIEYRYKVVDGTKLYRRLYNYSQQYWIGEWEYLGEGFIEPGVH